MLYLRTKYWKISPKHKGKTIFWNIFMHQVLILNCGLVNDSNHVCYCFFLNPKGENLFSSDNHYTSTDFK
jgi:hypothetical protein